MAYRWPGNLGELRSVLECALATNDGPVLEVGEQLLDGGLRVGSYRLIERPWMQMVKTSLLSP